MKKFLFALLGLVFAAPFAMADNIKMVTYFPVPYASYGDLSVSGTCDVGLLNNCSLDAGEKLNVYKLSSDGRVLNTGSLIANSGKLDLNSSASSSQINTTSLVSHNPSGQTASTGVLEFSHDLTVDTIKGASIQSAEATNRADMDALYLFGSSHRFPTCDGTDHKMSWQKLTVDGKSGVFLVCGLGEKADVEESCEDNPNQEKCCTANQEWNGTTCETKSCPTPTHYPPECSSCSFPYSSSSNGKLTIRGTACEYWNTETCDWDWNLSKCTPSYNIWLKTASMTGSGCASYYYNSSTEKLTSRPTVGGQCAGYGPNTVKTVWYFPKACSSSADFSCQCEAYICTNISPSATFTK